MRIDNNKGFTLVEVGVAIIIAITILAVSTPQIDFLYNNAQFSNGIRTVMTAMIRAKGWAINDGVQTAVTFTTDSNGRITCTAFVDDGSGGGAPDNGIRDGLETIIMNERLYSGITINPIFTTLQRTAANPFTLFNSNGFAMGAPGGNITLYNGIIAFNATIGGTVATRRINLAVSGNITSI